MAASKANVKANVRRQGQIDDGRHEWAKKNPNKVPKKSARRYQATKTEDEVEDEKKSKNETFSQADDSAGDQDDYVGFSDDVVTPLVSPPKRKRNDGSDTEPGKEHVE